MVLKPMFLHNRVNKKELRKKVAEESFQRVTISFYRYVHIEDPEKLRNKLFAYWQSIQVLGRIYIAHEGINAQMSVPEHNLKAFFKHLDKNPLFKDMPIKQAIEDSKTSFFALTMKVKSKIVADGLKDDTFNPGDTGQRLDAITFHEMVDKPDTIVVDMRNYYESEVGHFENAICPNVKTFKESLPKVVKELENMKDKNLLMYCTGGVRCEKASAWFKHNGFKKVYQLDGGIIQYAREIKKNGLKSKFIGKNFVFDERMGERITEDVISKCYTCGAISDNHVNCANLSCHTLIIQCEECSAEANGYCSEKCYNEANKSTAAC
jgi:UPF0176 protein